MRKRWRWWTLGAFCAISATLAWLAKPEDELAAIKKFHPVVRRFGPTQAGQTVYWFSQPILEVEAAVPGVRSPFIGPWDPNITMPSGRSATFGYNAFMGEKETCYLSVPDDTRPWYLRSWAAIKSKLGF